MFPILKRLFKRRGGAAAKPEAPPAPAAPAAPPVEDRRAQWQSRLDAARGDDARLLEVARGAPSLDLKLAAVEALASEDALKSAEREFRRHDRRVHRLAKQRLDTVVTAREARARAEALIGAAGALASDAAVPLNRLAQIDRDWQALASSQLDPGQAERFAAARERLDALMRERDARQEREQRWIGDARATLADLQRGLADAAARGAAGDADALVQVAQALRERRPGSAPTVAPDEALQTWLALADQVRARLAIIADCGAAGDALELRAPRSALISERWRALPALADAKLAASLDERMARAAPAAPPSPAAPRPLRAARPKPDDHELLARIDELLAQAEQALAAGQLAPMPAQLAAIDAALDALGRAPPDALRERRLALNAEFARLRGWQQWGGARAVDALVDEAETLARAAAAENAASTLDLDRHAGAIRDLRARWKALERQRAPTGAAPWQRFDAALQSAYAPIAARRQVQDLERRDNLAAREKLLDALDAVSATAPAGAGIGEHWRTQIRTLERFRADWHALGPLEQRVPRDARQALRRRLRQSLERIEAPLAQARAAAAAAREPLIEAAAALVRQAGPGDERAAAPESAQWREATASARALQDEWARRARELPLARPVEAALWARFRTPLDALFAQRQAAAQAADAGNAAQVAARDALIGRLGALDPEMPLAELRRALAEVDAAWREAPELPRSAFTAVDARYRSARDEVQGWIAGSAQRRWLSFCDTLAARLESSDVGERSDAAPAASGADAAAALPLQWEQALDRRVRLSADDAALVAEAIADRMLRLEASLALPSPPEFEAARRDLKLHAMKDALEGRSAAAPEAAQRTAWLLDLIGQRLDDPVQRERLRAIVAGLRRAPPDTIELAPTAG